MAESTRKAKELIGFWFAAEESSTVWKDILEKLKELGSRQVLVIATDNLPGVKEAVGEAFHLSADLQ